MKLRGRTVKGNMNVAEQKQMEELNERGNKFSINENVQAYFFFCNWSTFLSSSPMYVCSFCVAP